MYQTYAVRLHAGTPKLRDFRKVALQAGETQIVRLSIPVSELTILNEKNEAIVEPGEFEIQVGSASDHILLRKTIRVGQPQPVVNRQEQVLPKSERQITVQGVIRDVQATLIPEVRIYEKTTGKLLGKSDQSGKFHRKDRQSGDTALSEERLSISREVC